MLDLPTTLPPVDWLRLTLLYVHLLLCALALVTVLDADVRIATGRYTVAGLRRTAHLTAIVLGALWASGLGIVWLDTGLDPATLAAQPKVLLKLLTVLVLSANGVLLHFLSFPIIAGRSRPTFAQALLLAITGAASTSHWLLAAFVGIARPLAQWPLETLLAGYAAYCGATLLVAVASVPVLRRLLSTEGDDVSDGRRTRHVDVLVPARPAVRSDAVSDTVSHASPDAGTGIGIRPDILLPAWPKARPDRRPSTERPERLGARASRLLHEQVDVLLLPEASRRSACHAA